MPKPHFLEEALRYVASRLGWRVRGLEAGVTMIETVVVVVVVGVLALIAVPWMNCTFEKSHYAQVMEDMRQARALIEAYEAELGAWPPDLDTAFANRRPPDTLIYCTDGDDGNSGHGNEFCQFLDWENPSGQNQHGGTQSGYILRTYDELSRCADVRMAWLTCCGEEPHVVAWDGDDSDVPGHPGDPQGDTGGGDGGGSGN